MLRTLWMRMILNNYVFLWWIQSPVQYLYNFCNFIHKIPCQA